MTTDQGGRGTILVTTDGSDLGHLTLALRAGLTVLYVQPDPLPTEAVAYVYLPAVRGEAQEEALEAMREDLNRRLPGARVRLERALGCSMPRLILDLVREEGADLIVMSTHGRSGLGRVLLGSVAEAVAHHAPVPVLLVRAGQEVKDWTAAGA